MTEQDLFEHLLAAYFPGQKHNSQTDPQFTLVRDLVGYIFDEAGERVDTDRFLDYLGFERESNLRQDVLRKS